MLNGSVRYWDCSNLEEMRTKKEEIIQFGFVTLRKVSDPQICCLNYEFVNDASSKVKPFCPTPQLSIYLSICPIRRGSLPLISFSISLLI